MDPHELDDAIGTGDRNRLLDILIAADESHRRVCTGVADRWEERLRVYWTLPEQEQRVQMPRETAASIVSGLQLVRIAVGSRPPTHAAFNIDYAAAARVLAARRPAWLQDWVESALDQLPGCWPLVRALERSGAIRRPPLPSYVCGMIAAARPLLSTDPELHQEFWLLFEYEGSQAASMTMADSFRWNGETWTDVLCRLSEEGALSRERLLTASLAALRRDFPQYRSGWFSRFHEALKPTVEERAGRLSQYLALLASPIPPTVRFALRALDAIDRAERLPAGELIRYVPAALSAREKGTVLLALKLLGREVTRRPDAWRGAATAALNALVHTAPEVHSAVLDVIESVQSPLDAEVMALLVQHRDFVAPSQLKRLDTILQRHGASETATVPSGGVRLCVGEAEPTLPPPVDLPFHGVPRLDPSRKLLPILDIEELVEAAGVLLERWGPPEEIERVMDGVSRLCTVRPDDYSRRTAPLRKRARQLARATEDAGRFLGDPQRDLPLLMIAWLDGEVSDRTRPEEIGLDEFMGIRLHEIAIRAAKGASKPTLALPTHIGGWICPSTLVSRVRCAGSDIDLADAVQALLRLAPDGRERARSEAADLPGELGAALRHALGESGIAIGVSEALWIAAARSRDPFADDVAVDQRFPGGGPDSGLAARVEFSVEHEQHTYEGTTYHHHSLKVTRTPAIPPEISPYHPAVRVHVRAEQSIPVRRWSALVWPGGLHSWFARGAEALGSNLDWWEARWPNRVFLEPLVDPDTPLTGPALALLCTALGAKNPGESGLATDVLIAGITDGRIDREQFGGSLGSYLKDGLLLGTRVSRALTQAAQSGPLHVEVIRSAVERAIVQHPEIRPADLGALLTLLRELSIACGAAIESSEARSFLGTVLKGKSGTLARQILGLALDLERRSAHLRAAREAALEGRLPRMERWERSLAASAEEA